MCGALLAIAIGIIGDADHEVKVGDLWQTEWNSGVVGDANGVKPSATWEGGSQYDPLYLWQGRFWLGAVTPLGADTFVTQADYGSMEWGPSVENDTAGFTYLGPGKSDYDVEAIFHDNALTDQNVNNFAGRHLGVKVKWRALHWGGNPLDDFGAYEVYVTYNSAENDAGFGDTLTNAIVGITYDCDVCNADQSTPHIDDWVFYDGWANDEWDTLTTWTNKSDTLTILPDSFTVNPDGVWDGWQLYGDDPWETTLFGDTLRIPRGMSYMYDDDGDSSLCPGYIGVRTIYASPGPADSVAGGVRVVRPWAHQWWDWESDPATDGSKYLYMAGAHPAWDFYRYMPHPEEYGDTSFDYRFLLTFGPYDLVSGDTLKFVWGTVLGNGLVGGVSPYYFNGGWVRGVRQSSDYLMALYYCGSNTSDPAHPSGPDEDVHWDTTCVPLTALTERGETSALFELTPILGGVNVELVRAGKLTLTAYDAAGRSVERLHQGYLPEGVYTFRLSDALPSGVYLLRAALDSEARAVKAVLVR